MEEINHFSHEQHSLKLIENWETVLGVVADDEGNQSVVDCKGCREPISISGGAVVYGCVECGYFLHKTCVELPPTINHHSHPFHPLTINHQKRSGWSCDVCGDRDILPGFSYKCVECDFDSCLKCGVIAVAQGEAAIALKKEASIKFKCVGHPKHTLTLQLRPAAILCDACKSEEKDLFYLCDTCDFWIHKRCTSLASTLGLPHHPKHPLVLVYSLPENFYKYAYYCEFCNKRILQNDWLYHCANCRYFAHIKCALNAPPPRDDEGTSVATEEHDKDLLHFPMSYSFTDPLKLLNSGKVILDDNETYEINHWSHPHHSLILNLEEPQGNNKPDIDSSDLIEVCYGCVRPLSFPYYSCCQDGCSYTLHKYCAQLPRTLQHQLHPHHSLDLVDTSGHVYFYQCTGCYSCGKKLVYKCDQTNCNFSLCVNCAFLPNTIKHKYHNHPLTQLFDPKPGCKACNRLSKGISYSCKDCDFQLDMQCAMRSPQSLTHRYCKGHEIQLTYPPVENHPEDFYCDICEKEMHPKFWLYHCHKCKSSFHLGCISRIDFYANIIREGEVTNLSIHKHPLTYVRRQKGTPQYVCSVCNKDINGYLVLECRARLCNFVVCYYCRLNKKW